MTFFWTSLAVSLVGMHAEHWALLTRKVRLANFFRSLTVGCWLVAFCTFALYIVAR